jgi:hypothetical protein
MDPAYILNWNVRGLNSTARQDAVRVMVDTSKIDVVCLQETKMSLVSRRLVLSMLGSAFVNNFIYLVMEPVVEFGGLAESTGHCWSYQGGCSQCLGSFLPV